MIARVKYTTVFALYQFTITLGILMLPVALALARVGLSPPVHRLLETLDEALEDTHPGATR
jgi:hypothetical protein